MNAELRCERCGAELSGQAVGGQCANCLLNFALDQSDGGENLTVGIPSVRAEPSRVRYFGDYELLEEIARGGMGVVYRARQASLNRIVALKMILSGDFSSASAVQRFQAEAEAAARLDHANIVPIYEIGQHEGQQYFSMRFLEGGTLTEAIKGERFTPRKAAELMIVVARAVHYAHQHGIVHRDLKPGNILLDAKGEPHVADFGLAKLLESDSGMTQSQAVLGTPSYMAPEQASGSSKQATTASDVYSLGAILYELLTKRPPFKAETAMNTLHLVLESDPPQPRLLNRALDRDIETICLKCLEKDPQSRYASADALAEDLRCWLSDHPILARPVSTPERAFKWARRRPATASLIVAIHLVALAGLVGILWQSRRANSNARTATLEAQRANEQALQAAAESTRAESELWNARFNEARAIRAAGGPGARVQSRALLQKLVERRDLSETQQLGLREEAIAQLALVDIELSTNWISRTNWMPMHWNKYLTRYLRCSDSGRIDLLEYPSHRLIRSFHLPGGGILDQAVMSPDEQFLAARYGNGGVINVWRVANGDLIFDWVHKGPDFWPMSFSPDSRTMMIVADRGISLRSMDTSKALRVLNADRQVVRAAFSPNSSTIAAVLHNRTGEIWEADSGALLSHFHIDFPANRIAWHPDGTRLALSGDRGKLELRTVSHLSAAQIFVSSARPLSGHLGYIDRLFFAPDEPSLFTYSWDYQSISWDLVSARPQLRDSRINVSQVHASGEQLIVLREAPPSESVAKYLRRTGYKTLSSAGEPREPKGNWFSRDGRLGVTSYENTIAQAEGECVLWDSSSNAEIARIKGTWVQFNGTSDKLFVFERAANRVQSYDVSAQALASSSQSWPLGETTYEGRPGEMVNTGQMAADGRTLVIAATHAIIFVDTQGSQPVRRWNRSAHVLEISSDGKWLATMLHGALPILWDLQTGRERLAGPQFSLIKFSPDSKWVSVSSRDQVQIYGLDSLEPAGEPILFRASGSAPSVEFSPDGQFFAMVFDWRNVRLYETETRKHLATLIPPASGSTVSQLTFSADGEWLAAAKNDGETIGWHLPTIRKELDGLGLNWASQFDRKFKTDKNSEVKFDFSGVFNSEVRDASTPRELLDLSAYYTSTLDENWHPGTGNSDLAELPRGVQTLDGVAFDLRGLIQVGSSTRGGVPYPREAREIAVKLSCERLHFVHSAVMAFDMQAGTDVGSYIVHYEDGETIEIPIIFGRDVADWFSQTNESLPDLKLA